MTDDRRYIVVNTGGHALAEYDLRTYASAGSITIPDHAYTGQLHNHGSQIWYVTFIGTGFPHIVAQKQNGEVLMDFRYDKNYRDTVAYYGKGFTP